MTPFLGGQGLLCMLAEKFPKIYLAFFWVYFEAHGLTMICNFGKLCGKNL